MAETTASKFRALTGHDPRAPGVITNGRRLPEPSSISSPAIAAERQLCGALLLCGGDVATLIRLEDFADLRLRAVAAEALGMLTGGAEVTPIAIAARLDQRHGVDVNMLVDLLEEAATLGGGAAAPAAAEVVRDAAERRRLVAGARNLLVAAERGAPTDELRTLVQPAPAAEPAPSLIARDWLDVAQDPPTSWLVDGLIPQGGLVVLAGDPGSGKTLIAIDIALRAATGADWLGRRVKPHSTLLLAGEGTGGLAARLRAWRSAHPAAVPVGPHYVAIAGGVPNLASPSGAADLLTAVDACARAHGRTPDIVIVDTFARAAAGMDENDAAACSGVVANLARLQQARGCTVVVVHHVRKPSADRGATRSHHDLRGSGALAGAADQVLLACRDGDARTLRIAKSRDGVDGEQLAYSIRVVQTGATLPDGRQEFGPVVLPPAADSAPPDKADQLRVAAEERRRNVVEVVARAGGRVPTKSTIVELIPERRSAVFTAIRECIAAGDLVPDGEGLRLPTHPPTVPGSGSRPGAPLRGVGTAGTGNHDRTGGSQEPTGTDGNREPGEGQ